MLIPRTLLLVPRINLLILSIHLKNSKNKKNIIHPNSQTNQLQHNYKPTIKIPSDDQPICDDANGEYRSNGEEETEEIEFVDEDKQVPGCVLLTFNSKQTNIFTNFNPNQTLTGKNLPLFHDRCSLFRSPLINFMEALQDNFAIKNDVALYFPQLKLKFYTHMRFSEKLSLLDLFFLASKVANEGDKSILLIDLLEEKDNFVSQYNLLLSVTDDIVSSDDEAEEFESEHVVDEFDQTEIFNDDCKLNGNQELLAKRKRYPEMKDENFTKRQKPSND